MLNAKRDLDSCTSISIDDYLFIDSFGYNALCICLCFLLNFVASSIGYGKPAGTKNPHGYGEASPHKRRLKCVTNISPRRLMTHLLHQMVHYRTTLRVSEQRSATIARITIHTHAMILKTKRKSSESCAMRYLLRVTLIHRQGWVQDGTPTQRRRVQSLD